MFDFGNANVNQRKAISTTDGPVLITAGPGTGKTYTLVQRTVYLIEECGVQPENIFIATFTEKAAMELITRITNELGAKNIITSVRDIYIGTFHSLCLRILKENLEYTRLHKNFRILDAFDQQYTVFQNIYRFRNIKGIELALPSSSAWKQAEAICTYVNNLSEELVSFENIIADPDSSIAVFGEILKTYHKLLVDKNLMDFSSIQVEAFLLLNNNPSILKALQAQITHIMVDEYQDTNFIQEQLIFLLAGKRRNICVVGDDDQGLYRFRGATIRNILEFPNKFSEGECQIVPLVINYRSNSDIVDFYNKWMVTTSGKKFKFEWDRYRLTKKIEPKEKTTFLSPAVVKLSSLDNIDEWHEAILNFINTLKDSGKIKDLNQVAFLFNSVKHPRVTSLAKYLESNHINVYSPRSDMFFQRDEIRIAIGSLMLLFPNYVQLLEKGEHSFLKSEHLMYYLDCIRFSNEHLAQPEYAIFRKWLRTKGKEHINLSKPTDYAYSGLLYQMFQFPPFNSILDTKIDTDMIDIRPSRNLAKLTQIIGKFEHLHRVDVLDPREFRGKRKIDQSTEKLFNLYLKLLFDGGMAEYEDDSEYAPSGCISFLTIHQSKGMEFPIVVVDSLQTYPRTNINKTMVKIEERYFKRPVFEPIETTKYFDFWRLYYTAFSRAQDLLILTCDENKKTPSIYLKSIYTGLHHVDSNAFNLQEFDFKPIRDVNIKNSYSFTSNVAVYETCSRQYKFYKELGFLPVRTSAILFGTLVHETIEDVHKAVLRNEAHSITTENVKAWFDANYLTLSSAEHSYLASPQKKAALHQVLRYVEGQRGNWSKIQQAEVEVSLVKSDYIIIGKVDLIRGEEGSVEIVDFKSELKPDMEKMREKLELHRRQLSTYAYLVEQKTGHKVSKMHLYYTAEENGLPTITYPYQKKAVDKAMDSFDNIVRKIMKKDFSKGSEDLKICRNCDFRFYCMNK